MPSVRNASSSSPITSASQRSVLSWEASGSQLHVAGPPCPWTGPRTPGWLWNGCASLHALPFTWRLQTWAKWQSAREQPFTQLKFLHNYYYPAIWTKVCKGRSQGWFLHCISNHSVEMVGVEARQIIINGLNMTKFVIILQYRWPTKIGTKLHNFNCVC